MVGVIVVSILPLMFMQTYTVFKVTEMIATAIFVGSRETLGKLVCEKVM
jgi:hypothetical protein